MQEHDIPTMHPARSSVNGSEPPARAPRPYKIAVLGLSISSSWGNGHATTYRSLIRELRRRGHDVAFYERDVPWYDAHRDLPDPPYCRLALYKDVDELRARYGDAIRQADFVIVGSFVPDGVEVARWVLDSAEGSVAFYDIDTPVTLSKIDRGDFEYLHPDLIPRFQLYLSFTGGNTLNRLEHEFGVPAARPLYCSVDADEYYPDGGAVEYDLGYMGTYSDDRQPGLERRLVDSARRWADGRFIVAGPGYPDEVAWPPNVERVQHLPPAKHRRFYNAQRFTLNVTRTEMLRVGFAPSVRLFEAAACGTPIISDYWEGLETIFEPGQEILITNGADDTIAYVCEMPEDDRRAVGRRARQKVLSAHTAAHRARELEAHLEEVTKNEQDFVTE